MVSSGLALAQRAYPGAVLGHSGPHFSRNPGLLREQDPNWDGATYQRIFHGKFREVLDDFNDALWQPAA